MRVIIFHDGALSKLKALADDIFNKAKMVQIFVHRAENITENGENAVCLQFLLLWKYFQEASPMK